MLSSDALSAGEGKNSDRQGLLCSVLPKELWSRLPLRSVVGIASVKLQNKKAQVSVYAPLIPPVQHGGQGALLGPRPSKVCRSLSQQLRHEAPSDTRPLHSRFLVQI